jgi:hypothetical protein
LKILWDLSGSLVPYFFMDGVLLVARGAGPGWFVAYLVIGVAGRRIVHVKWHLVLVGHSKKGVLLV